MLRVNSWQLQHYSCSQNIVLWRISPGAVDESQPFQMDGEFRDRIAIAAKTMTTTCFLDVINLLRKKIGPIHPSYAGLIESRKAEEIFEKFRKVLIDHENNLPCQSFWLDNPRTQEILQALTRNNVASIIAQWDNLEKVRPNPEMLLLHQLPCLDKICQEQDNEIGRRHNSSLPFLRDFYQKPLECSNFFAYLQKLKFGSRLAIYKQFILDLEEQKQITAYEELEKTGSLKELSSLYQEITRALILWKFCFTHSSFIPKESFDVFFGHIKKAPHIFTGYLGRLYYQTEAGVVGKIGRRQIYGWKPTAEKREFDSTRHCVIVVGARKGEKKNLVFYIDPMDGSDPNDEEKQRIYVISYDNFVKRIFPMISSPVTGDVFSVYYDK